MRVLTTNSSDATTVRPNNPRQAAENQPLLHNVSLDGRLASEILTAVGSGRRIEVQKLDAKADWFGKPAEGASKSASKPLAIVVSSASLALDSKAETLAPTTLDVKLGDLPVKVDVQGEKLFSAYVINGKIQVPKSSPRTRTVTSKSWASTVAQTHWSRA